MASGYALRHLAHQGNANLQNFQDLTLFALAAKDSNVKFVLITLLPVLSFWGLDAYYLRQERLFRKLYDELRLASREEAKKVEPFTLSTARYVPDVQSWFRTLWSRTVIALHGIVVGAVLLVIVIFYFPR